MKTLKILPLFLFFFGHSQDKIFMKNNDSTIESKVIEITPSEVKYRKSDNLEGPLYTVTKSSILRIEYENGQQETFNSNNNRQKSIELLPTSKLVLQHSKVEKKRNTDGDGVLSITNKELKNLTKCKIINSENDADFLVHMQLIKGTLGNRKAQMTITHLLSGKVIYQSKWFKGAPSEFNGFSGSRRVIGKIIKKSLLKKYPEIRK